MSQQAILSNENDDARKWSWNDVVKYVPDTAGCAILVLENVRSNHIASLPHMILQILPLRLKRQIANKQSSAFNIFAVCIALLHLHNLTLIPLTSIMMVILAVLVVATIAVVIESAITIVETTIRMITPKISLL